MLIEKIKSIYNIGVKTFGLLLDDIPWEFQYDEDKEAWVDYETSSYTGAG